MLTFVMLPPQKNWYDADASQYRLAQVEESEAQTILTPHRLAQTDGRFGVVINGSFSDLVEWDTFTRLAQYLSVREFNEIFDRLVLEQKYPKSFDLKKRSAHFTEVLRPWVEAAYDSDHPEFVLLSMAVSDEREPIRWKRVASKYASPDIIRMIQKGTTLEFLETALDSDVDLNVLESVVH